jgi:hypothetical protein
MKILLRSSRFFAGLKTMAWMEQSAVSNNGKNGRCSLLLRFDALDSSKLFKATVEDPQDTLG